MNKINSMRAKLLLQKINRDQESNVKITFAEMVNEIMTIPSYFENECCTISVRSHPIIYSNHEILKDDLSNIAHAIESNFPEIPNCTRCKKPEYQRHFGNHVLIEVRRKFNQK